MTKKDFIVLADVIKQARIDERSYDLEIDECLVRDGMLHYITQRLADALQRDNPAFKRDRWLGYIAGTNGPNGGARAIPSQPTVAEHKSRTDPGIHNVQ